jgi:hypothetical protein
VSKIIWDMDPHPIAEVPGIDFGTHGPFSPGLGGSDEYHVTDFDFGGDIIAPAGYCAQHPQSYQQMLQPYQQMPYPHQSFQQMLLHQLLPQDHQLPSYYYQQEQEQAVDDDRGNNAIPMDYYDVQAVDHALSPPPPPPPPPPSAEAEAEAASPPPLPQPLVFRRGDQIDAADLHRQLAELATCLVEASRRNAEASNALRGSLAKFTKFTNFLSHSGSGIVKTTAVPAAAGGSSKQQQQKKTTKKKKIIAASGSPPTKPSAAAAAAAAAAAKKTRKCSHCMAPGHNKRACPGIQSEADADADVDVDAAVGAAGLGLGLGLVAEVPL